MQKDGATDVPTKRRRQRAGRNRLRDGQGCRNCRVEAQRVEELSRQLQTRRGADSGFTVREVHDVVVVVGRASRHVRRALPGRCRPVVTIMVMMPAVVTVAVTVIVMMMRVIVRMGGQTAEVKMGSLGMAGRNGSVTLRVTMRERDALGKLN